MKLYENILFFLLFICYKNNYRNKRKNVQFLFHWFEVINFIYIFFLIFNMYFFLWNNHWKRLLQCQMIQFCFRTLYNFSLRCILEKKRILNRILLENSVFPWSYVMSTSTRIKGRILPRTPFVLMMPLTTAQVSLKEKGMASVNCSPSIPREISFMLLQRTPNIYISRCNLAQKSSKMA